MADRHRDPAVWDGRFGERFDDEVSSKAIGWTLVGVGLMTAAFMVAMIFMLRFIESHLAEQRPTAPAVALADPRSGPPWPRLQAKPEAELIAMRREMAARLEGWGWVDREAGIVHLPIDRAMAWVLENGLPPAQPMPPTDAEPADGLAVGELQAVGDAG